MQKREKIILGGAGLALLYFAIDTVSGFGGSGPIATTDLSRECDQFLARGKVTLSTLKSSPELFRRIALLEGRDATRNPFIRNVLNPDSAAASEEAPRRRVRYTGYFSTATKCMVVINEKEYSVNEIIEGTDLLILEITSEQVVLQSQTPNEDGSENTEFVTVLKEEENYAFIP